MIPDSTLGNNAKRVADAAKNFACEAYRTVPAALIPNPVDSGLRMFWDNFCGTPAFPDSPALPLLPVPPAPPFMGGQCPCEVYTVSYTSYFGSSSEVPYIVQDRTTRVQGKIGGVFSIQNAPNNWELGFICQGSSVEVCRSFPFQLKVHNSDKTKDGKIPYLVIRSVVKLDGSVDNCGSLPASYPPAPVPPNNTFVSSPTSIVYNDGTVNNYTFSFKIPATDLLRKTLPSLTVNVTNPQLTFPINFNFGGDITYEPPLVPPPIALPPDVTTNINNTNNVVNNLAKDLGFVLVPPNYANNPTVDIEIREGGEQDNVDKDDILGVKITLSELPDKAQYGMPNIYFGGWLSFKLQGGYIERKQINYEVSYFEAPPGCKGYSYTLTNGGVGSAVVYSKKPA
jgi:hypothetical protein